MEKSSREKTKTLLFAILITKRIFRRYKLDKYLFSDLLRFDELLEMCN